jgi:predicted Zn-dependent protease
MTALISRNHVLSTEDQRRLERVRELYDSGLYLQAYATGREWGNLTAWPGSGGQLMAGRLATNLGGARLGEWLLRRAYRSAPDDAEARYFYGYALFRRFGPYRAWRWTRTHNDLPAETNSDIRSSWAALQGEVAAYLRDFTTAEQFIAEARRIAPESAWVTVCAACVLEMQDRYEAALDEINSALAVRPFYRPAVQSKAHLLTLLERDEEAVELLKEATERLESGAIAGQLFTVLIELKRYQEANHALQRFLAFSPLLEKKELKRLAGPQSDVAYHLGDLDAAITHAENSPKPFYKAVAERLRDPAHRGEPVILLPVGFVRQHHLTCAPATLSAISRYWSMPAEHLQVADEICYDGTSHYNERKWATDHGWIAREFSVTEDATRGLISRGIPFTFTTVEPASAHLQAIIGYDGRRGTVLVRDPFWRNAGEAIASKFFEKYRAYGPRGMVLVPQDRAEKLEGLELPDASLWDCLHRLDHALQTHQREVAEAAALELEQAAPGHRLALEARRRLAIYDGNPVRQLAIVEQLVALFPDNPALQFERMRLQQHHTRRADRLEICEKLCAKPDCHPIFWQQLAEELQCDARRREDARQLLLKGIRRWPMEAFNYRLLANLYWDERRYDEALELYRFAACLSDKDEQLASAYFSAARWCKQTEQVLQLLEDRFARFGRKSYHPARTLVQAYFDLNREGDALATIEAAVKLRPNDGQLLLYAASTYLLASHSYASRAAELIEQAKGNSPQGAWLRTSARHLRLMADLPGALARWREVAAIQPHAVDALREIADLLAQLEGRPVAIAYLKQQIEQSPRFYPLYELLIEWLREESWEERKAVIYQALELNPDDAWLQRELAFLLGENRRFEEAWSHAELASKLEPHNPSCFYLRGMLFRAQGKIDEARAAMRATIEASIDADFAIAALIELCETQQERREALHFIKDQLVKQFTLGDGLLAYRTYASETLEPEEVLALLNEALAARPDLWSAWSACVRQLLAMNRQDEAEPLVEQATQKFPLTPRMWVDRSLVARARGNAQEEIESLENALRINPGWEVAGYMLADALERQGAPREARRVLEQLVARNPFDPSSTCRLAEMEWNDGERNAAVDRLEKVAVANPSYAPAWEMLAQYSHQLGCAERAVAAARQLTDQRPGEARSWLWLAQALDPNELDERIAAWDRALSLNPQCISAYEDKARALVATERWDEALAACNPPAFQGRRPSELRLRHGIIEAERGNLPEAIRIVEALVAEQPHLYSAWTYLADWYSVQNEPPQLLRAAEMLVRLNPQYEVSLGYLGNARELNGDLAGAQEAFARAFELNPRYGGAGIRLFDRQLEAGEYDAAAETLKKVRALAAVDDSYILARQIKLAAKQQDETTALRVLPDLCMSDESNSWPLKEAITAMMEAGWSSSALQVVTQCLAPPAAGEPKRPHGYLGAMWVLLQTNAGNWFYDSQLHQMMQHSELGPNAIYAYIDALITHNRLDIFVSFAIRNRSWLRENTLCWASVTRAYCYFRLYDKGLAWIEGWQDRSDDLPWMLVNTVEILRNNGRHDEAAVASQRALSRPPSHGQQLHQFWLACDAACAGRLDEAALRLEQAGPINDMDYQFLARLAQILLTQAAAGAGNDAAFRTAIAELVWLRQQYPVFSVEPARRRAYSQIAVRVAAQRGGLKAWCWLIYERYLRPVVDCVARLAG